MSKNNATLYDPKMLIQAGIDPKTGLPIALRDISCGYDMKSEIRKQLRIVDEQDAVNRYVWYNLPEGLNSRLMERILYYKGQAMLFYFNEKFYFLPYALTGQIDVYGRFKEVTPLPFTGTSNDGEKAGPWIQGLTFNPVYDVQLPEDFSGKTDEQVREFLKKSCVIFKDYTEQYSQTNIARQVLNDPVVDLMAECFPLMRTALINSTGVEGMRVGDESESSSVYLANEAIYKAAISGKAKIPIIGSLDFQNLASGNVAKAEEFLLAMQSLDNYRLSLYGLDNGGLFLKKSHILQAEQEMNTGNVGLVMQDGLSYRQEQATIANSIWGLDMWCEISETVIGSDITGDGIAGSDEADQMENNQQEEFSDVADPDNI